MKLDEKGFVDDPYGEAMDIITQALSISMSDGINEAMSDEEYSTLEEIAKRIAAYDPLSAKKIEPRESP